MEFCIRGHYVENLIFPIGILARFAAVSGHVILVLLPNKLIAVKCHIRLQAIFENLKIAMLFFGLLKRLSLESDIFRL
jgi:hypothetical protein